MEEPQILGKKYFLSEPQEWLNSYFSFHKWKLLTPLYHHFLFKKEANKMILLALSAGKRHFP